MKSLSRLGFIVLAIWSLSANATEYRFYAAAGIKLPLIELSRLFNQTNPQSQLINHFDTAGAAEKKFLADPKSTCLITTQIRINQALKSGTVVGQVQIPLTDTLAGIASSQKVKPVITNSNELVSALLAAKSIAFSNPANGATVGLHFQQLIKKLDIEKAVMDKAILADDGVETMKLVIAKKVDLGITQMSEVIQADRTTLVGPFPSEFELATRYSLWCKDPSLPEISAFIGLMQSDFGSRIFSESGLRPVRQTAR